MSELVKIFTFMRSIQLFGPLFSDIRNYDIYPRIRKFWLPICLQDQKVALSSEHASRVRYFLWEPSWIGVHGFLITWITNATPAQVLLIQNTVKVHFQQRPVFLLCLHSDQRNITHSLLHARDHLESMILGEKISHCTGTTLPKFSLLPQSFSREAFYCFL